MSGLATLPHKSSAHWQYSLMSLFTARQMTDSTREVQRHPFIQIFHNINNNKKIQRFAEREIYPLASEIYLGRGILLNFRKITSIMIRGQGNVLI